MMVVSVIGLVGVGKSSLIMHLVEDACGAGETAGVVVNDEGTVSLEAELGADYPVTRIGGG